MLSLHGSATGGIPKLDHEHYMSQAIAAAQHAPRRPFGTVIVDAGEDRVVEVGWNRSQRNPTWHGEIDAINRLWAKSPPAAPGRLVLYTTAEPCVMCQGAIIWAGIDAVVFGTSVATLTGLGWDQFQFSAAEVIAGSHRPRIGLVGGVLETQCDELFRQATRCGS